MTETRALVAGKDHVQVGTVTTERRDDDAAGSVLVVTFTLDETSEWRIAESAVHVGDRNDVLNPAGRPRIGHFASVSDYGAEGGTAECTHEIDVSGQSGTVDVLAHAALEMVVDEAGEVDADPADRDPDVDDEVTILSEGAWADGQYVKPARPHPRHPGRFIGGGSNALYFPFDLGSGSESGSGDGE